MRHMHKLHKFFEAKLANHLSYRVNTGNPNFCEVYERRYRLEVVAVDDTAVDFLVTSFDVVPAGMRSGGTEKGFGTATVPFGDSIEAMVKSAVVGSDPTFFKKYPSAEGAAV